MYGSSSEIQDSEWSDGDMSPLKKPVMEDVPEEHRGRTRRERRERIQNMHCYIVQTSVTATGLAAAAITRQVESMTWGEIQAEIKLEGSGDSLHIFRGPWATLATTCNEMTANMMTIFNEAAVGGLQMLGDAVSGTSFAISELRRVLAQEDTPLALFLAIDLFLVLAIASLALFVAAFWATPSPNEGVIGGNTQKMLIAASGKRFIGKVNGIAGAFLAFVAGSAATLDHPLRSALLCAI